MWASLRTDIWEIIWLASAVTGLSIFWHRARRGARSNAGGWACALFNIGDRPCYCRRKRTRESHACMTLRAIALPE